MSNTWDVVAVNLTDFKVRLLAEDKDERNADAIVFMAVMRRGCNEEFFCEVAHGQYKEGDKWGSAK